MKKKSQMFGLSVSIKLDSAKIFPKRFVETATPSVKPGRLEKMPAENVDNGVARQEIKKGTKSLSSPSNKHISAVLILKKIIEKRHGFRLLHAYISSSAIIPDPFDFFTAIRCVQIPSIEIKTLVVIYCILYL